MGEAVVAMRPASRTMVLFALALACSAGADILGPKPAYFDTLAADVPNEQAFGRRFWMPGLEDGFVPQGLTIAGGQVLVAAYRSADPNVSRGPCRIFSVDMATGKPSGQFDMPPEYSCHGGGLANLGKGMLLLADTREVFRIDLERSLATGSAVLRGDVKLKGWIYGSYAAFDGRDAWIGTWTKTRPEIARFHRLGAGFFEDNDGRTVDEGAAAEALPIPMQIQGAAFDSAGGLWMTMSNSHEGTLYRIDRASGAILARYDIVPGIEDIEFDDAGRLWAVSEAGARKYMGWPRHYPLIFEIDVAKLK